MEKERIRFDGADNLIRHYRLTMHQGETFRGIHSHTAIEVVAVKSGRLSCYVNDACVELHPEEILLINSNTAHKLASDHAEIAYIHINIGFLEKHLNDDGDSNLHRFISHTQAKPYMIFRNCQELLEILRKIAGRYYEEQAHSRWYLKAYTYELFAFMCEHFFVLSSELSAKQSEKIQQIVKYIDENFKSGITLEDICSAVNYNKYAVCHYFKSVTGGTVFDYINFLRVHSAIEELKQTNHSILEIAANSGFSSPTYFNRVFKSIIGCTPSTYRRACTENP